MNIAVLDDFPDSARVWVFGSERELAGGEAGVLLEAVDAFLAGWAAHGVPLRAARSWCYDRFLVVAVDIESAPPSGCSIDALVTVLRGLEDGLGVRFLGNEAVWYRDSRGTIRRASRPAFRALAGNGEVVPETVVFDNSVTVLADLRGGRWEGPARERWHAALFD
ncbi:MAG: hypothetical protein OXH51_13465 [Gemmatimonadetes bacterium]|nr:hypothetical protein [Gemmatimonadota bacterium]MCY3612531.1 hypothetical protein [Gemmatimonadota bacterium]MCY3678248.1 hypothetical protein [Gemmatimonadota bacterium]MYA41729.1 hypothetical protein [Gemmatimonadota bacterium]MYE94821.1 hypothetical protein [Gemmatimonadota bacterium]